MRTGTIPIVLALMVAAGASPPRALALDGSVTVGGTIVNQTGDRTAVQEMSNVYDGFTVSQIHLAGPLGRGRSLLLDLQDVNLDSRKGELDFRVPGALHLSAGFGQHRQFFSPDGAVHSMRKDWRAGADLTPTRWLTLNGAFGYRSRDGDRTSFPPGVLSALGTRYDNALRSGEVSVDVHQARRGAAVAYQASGYTDRLDRAADRTGQLVSLRLYSPLPVYDRLTNFVRASYGVRRLSDRSLEYQLYDLQYTGVLQATEALRLRYGFQADRVDDQSLDLRTERFVNELDATWFDRHGQLDAGYSYETNDDDRSLTSYNGWHVGATLRPDKRVNARVEYASRTKKDLEHLTLLEDIESSQTRARLELRPVADLTVGSTYARREREFPDIAVDLEGDVVTAYGRYGVRGWGALSADYSYSRDDFRDRVGGFHTRNHIVTSRVDFDRLVGLHLAGGVTFLDLRRDLDIEKSLVFAEGTYRIAQRYRLTATYNAFNYDDYVLLDRYYTANVLRLGVGYDLHFE